MTAYYNEIDAGAAQWLRNLIEAGHIAPGYVDERSIEDVYPGDLRGFSQCHFFAGIGIWSYALRQAGFSDNRSVWTGSCPCQPFSAAGKGAGFDDERHLWPAFEHLIRECKPELVLGEQVASKDSGPWIDLVHTDLEALGYAFGAVPFPASGVGAPHIRDRLYWVANAQSNGHERAGQLNKPAGRHGAAHLRAVVGMADGNQKRRGRRKGVSSGCIDDRADAGRLQSHDGPVCIGEAGNARNSTTGPTNGFWRDADWLGCRDDKWRPVEPGTFPLVNGAASRVVRLRAYGNSIAAPAAQAFIEVVMESI